MDGEFNWIPHQTTKKKKDLESSEGDNDLVKDLEQDIEDIDIALDMVFEKLNRIGNVWLG